MQGSEGQEPRRATPHHWILPGPHQHPDSANPHLRDGLAAGRVDGGCAGLRGLLSVSVLISLSIPVPSGLVFSLIISIIVVFNGFVSHCEPTRVKLTTSE
jgi:hypothetical protein